MWNYHVKLPCEITLLVRCVHPAICPPGMRQPILTAQCSQRMVKIDKLILLSELACTLNVRFPPFSTQTFTRTSLHTNSCPALPTADISSHALLLVCTLLSKQERSLRLPHPPPYLVLTHYISMSYVKQALLSSLMAAHYRKDPGSPHDACSSPKLSFLPCSLMINSVSFLLLNSSNTSTHLGYPTPHPCPPP